MQALLEFIMRGRLQAAIVAMIGSWFPLVSPAVVALVSLRKGAFEGALTMVWAMLPALFALLLSQQELSEIGPLIPLVSLIGLVAVLLAAQLLRASMSWPYTLMGLVALSCAAALLLALALPSPVAALTTALGDLLRQMQATAPEGAAIVSLSSTFVVGLVAYVIALSGLGSLLLARWWQASLYNPGGFQQEFHRMRLTPVQALSCVAAAAYCFSQSADYQTWGGLFSMPLLISGVALLHHLVKARKLGLGWLVFMYVGLFLISPLSSLVSALAVADAWLNLRERLQAKGSDNV